MRSRQNEEETADALCVDFPVKEPSRARRTLSLGTPLTVAVDVVIFTVQQGALKVLLTRREQPPFQGRWALPGGFIDSHESAEDAAERELETRTSLRGVFLEQLYTFTAPERDPRTRVVSIAYYALVSAGRLTAHGTMETRWIAISTDSTGTVRLATEGLASEGDEESGLAFDHVRILQTAVERIRGKLSYAPIGFQLLPERFTVSDIRQVYEAVLGRPVDKRNFRAKLLKSGLMREVDAYRTGAHRPARLYTFVDRTF